MDSGTWLWMRTHPVWMLPLAMPAFGNQLSSWSFPTENALGLTLTSLTFNSQKSRSFDNRHRQGFTCWTHQRSRYKRDASSNREARVQRLLGLSQYMYLGKFLPCLSDITRPFRELTRTMYSGPGEHLKKKHWMHWKKLWQLHVPLFCATTTWKRKLPSNVMCPNLD